MKKSLWNRRIPTVLAFALIFASVWVTSALIQSGVLTTGRASLDTSPQNITITNITDTSFTVAFSTTQQVAAGVTLDDFGGTLLLDDRDKPTGNQKPYYAHHVTVPNLKPNTEYQFSIISNAETILDNGKKFSVKTANPISQKPFDQKPLFGKILLPDGNNSGDTLIFVEIEGGQKISAVTKTNGEYIIPTNSIRTTNLSAYLQLQDSTKIILNAFRKDLKSSLTLLYKNASSIPPITLSQSYNFADSLFQPQASESSLLTVPQKPNIRGEVRITSPANKASLVDPRPTFRGTALAQKAVQITISINANIKTTVTADRNGIWSFRPQAALAAGDHTITVQAQDSSGIVRQVQQTFTIFSSGTQVQQTATPSATPIPTAVPTAAPTTIPTAIPTPSPTLAPGITAAPTATPTAVPTAIPTAIPTVAPTLTTPPVVVISPSPVAQVPPPVSGSGTTMLLTFVSILFILTGASLLFILG